MQAGGATGSDALAAFDLSERFLSYFRYAPTSDEALSVFGAAPYRNASGETISWKDPVAGTVSCYAPDDT